MVLNDISDKKRKKLLSKIHNAALKVFEKKGYIGTTLEDIAAAAKMSKGSIYYYFKKKEEILFFILDHYMDLILENLDLELEEIQENIEKVRYIITRHTRIHTNNLAAAKILLNDAYSLSPKSLKKILEKEREYLFKIKQPLYDLYRDLELNKELRTVITFLLLGMCNWTVSWYNAKGKVSPEKLSNVILRVFMEGVTGLEGKDSEEDSIDILR